MKNEINEAFKPYKVGEEVIYCGKRAKITYIDNFSNWDNEIEQLELWYEDKSGQIHTVSLCPRNVKQQVAKIL